MLDRLLGTFCAKRSFSPNRSSRLIQSREKVNASCAAKYLHSKVLNRGAEMQCHVSLARTSDPVEPVTSCGESSCTQGTADTRV